MPGSWPPMSRRGAEITAAAVSAFEARIGAKLPADYAEFLLEVNGGRSAELGIGGLLWFVPLLFVVIRPAAVLVGTLGACVKPSQRLLIGWFGVRGVGSIYYLSLAINHGLPHGTAQLLIGLVLMTVAASVLVHGVSVTPLLSLYRRAGRA